MTEFITVMREYNRMCEKSMKCENCPIVSSNNGRGVACHLFVRKFPEEAERIIMQWAAEHQVMTNRRKFEEVFGFNIASLFDVNNRHVAEWLCEEYKEKNANE